MGEYKVGLFNLFNKKSAKNKNELFAKEIAEKIINAIAESEYSKISGIIDEWGRGWAEDLLKQFIETYKSDNELDCIDKYGTPCNFNPEYADGSKYEQEDFDFGEDNEGLSYEYELTTNGELNDLTLSLDFIYKGNKTDIIFKDLHVM